MTLLTILSSTSTKDLIRIINSEKSYIKFNVNIFNAGVIITPQLSDEYKQINYRTHNGYDCVLENDSTTKYYIFKELEGRTLETKRQKTIFNKFKRIFN